MDDSGWQQRLAIIERFVSESVSHAREGVDVDLSGLDEQIEKVTQQLMRLPPEEALGARERLQTLLDQMQSLGQNLHTQQAALRKQINGLNLQKKAHLAYRKTDIMPQDN